MKIILLTILSFLSFNSISQNNLEFYASPFIYRIGNLEKSSIKTINTNFVKVNFYNTPSTEFGISFNLPSKKKIFYGGGISWRNYSYKFNIHVRKFVDGIIYQTRTRKINSKLFSFKAFVGIKLLNNIKLKLIMELNFPYNTRENVLFYNNETTSVTDARPYYYYTYTIKENFNQRFSSKFLMPEINISTPILNNFHLNFGAKLKFYSFRDYYTINVTGKIQSYSEPEKLLETFLDMKIDSKQMFFYAGLSYTFKLKKK